VRVWLENSGFQPQYSFNALRKSLMTTPQLAQPNRTTADATSLHDQLAVAMSEANYVQVGEAVFTADYLHAPDEFTRPDDVLVEGSHDEAELLLIQRDFEGAFFDGNGDVVLNDGTMIRFLRSARVH
jgi:hypothetical protein